MNLDFKNGNLKTNLYINVFVFLNLKPFMRSSADTRATLFVISAPSGAGKTSLVKALLNDLDNIQVSISHTTRAKRSNEKEGVDYHFIDDHQFLDLLHQGAFLEHASVFDYHYGTSKNWVQETLDKGIDVVLEIDWQGAQQIASIIACATVFILPPSINTLRSRLVGRDQDDSIVIENRLAKAKDEIAHFDCADYVVINVDFDTALSQLKSIILAERLKTSLQKQRHTNLIKSLLSP